MVKKSLKNNATNGLLIFLVFLSTTTLIFTAMISRRGSFYHGEAFGEFYPFLEYFFGYLKQGNLALWLPHIFSGYPIIANIRLSLFYPINFLLAMALPINVAMVVIILLHYVLAGISMYLYASILRLGRYACLICAFVFMFNGFLLDQFDQLHTLGTIIWLPLILFLIEKALVSYNFKYSIFAGIVFGLQFLGGHFQNSYYITFMLIAYMLWKYLGVLEHKERSKHFARISLIWLVIFVIGLGLFSVQLLPTYELVKESARFENTYDNAVKGEEDNLSLANIVGYIFPTDKEDGYPGIGIVPFLLVAIAVLSRKRRIVYFYFAIGLLTLLLAAGKNAPFFTALYKLNLPGFSMFKDPIRIQYLSIFSASVLAGIGFDSVINAREQQKGTRRIIIFLISVLAIIIIALLYKVGHDRYVLSTLSYGLVHLKEALGASSARLAIFFREARIRELVIFSVISIFFVASVVLYIKKRLKPAVFKPMVASLVFANLFIFGREQIPLAAEEHPRNAPETATFLKRDSGFYRMCSYDIYEVLQQKIEEINVSYGNWFTIENVEEDVLRNEGLMRNASVPFGIDSISGYALLPLRRYLQMTKAGADVDPLRYKGYQDFVRYPTLLKLFNSKYVIVARESRLFEPPEFELVHSTERHKIYGYKDHLPRAFVVPKAMVIKDEHEILETLKNDSFDPREYVILEEEIKRPLVRNSSSVEEAYASIIEYLPNRVTIEVLNKSEGFLVLLDTNYPGWKVYVDNKKDKIYQADYLFRAVYLPKGHHVVRFIYDPFSFKLGLFITTLTLFSSGFSLVLIGYGKRRRS